MVTIAPGSLITCLDHHIVAEVLHPSAFGDPDEVIVGNWRMNAPGERRGHRCHCGAPFWRAEPVPAYHVRGHGWIAVRET